MEERGYVLFEDESGNEFELDIIDEFEYEGKNYAVLMDLSDLLDDNGELPDTEIEEDREMYIMQVSGEGEDEQFLPVEEEELLDKLSDIVYQRINPEEEE
jgi:hypothetical protein